MPTAIELDDVTLVYEERNPGSRDSGTAVVFVATMTFRPGRTAALR